MCYKIEASFLLIHILKSNDYCTIKELVRKKNIIEEKIPSVFIDVSRHSVLNSIECFPEIFQYTEDRICKNVHSHGFFEESVIEYFDFGIDDSIRHRITKILEDGAY